MKLSKTLAIYVFLLILLALNFIYGETVLPLIYVSFIALGFLTVIIVVTLNIKKKARKYIFLTLLSLTVLLLVIVLMIQGIL